MFRFLPSFSQADGPPHPRSASEPLRLKKKKLGLTLARRSFRPVYGQCHGSLAFFVLGGGGGSFGWLRANVCVFSGQPCFNLPHLVQLVMRKIVPPWRRMETPKVWTRERAREQAGPCHLVCGVGVVRSSRDKPETECTDGGAIRYSRCDSTRIPVFADVARHRASS